MILADIFSHPAINQLESLQSTPFHLVSFIIFTLAVIHTLSVQKIHEWARYLRSKQHPKHQTISPTRSLGVSLLFFLAEVEIVFAFWAIPLFITIAFFYGWEVSLTYINTRNYTETLFVVVILALASTKPIIHVAEKTICWISNRLGGSLCIWWLTLLTVGPILGSFITEAGAMALCALLLGRQFYPLHPSQKLAYATLGLLFVNISVGGVLTDFASPAVLILAHKWKWTLSDMFINFGWKAILGIVSANLLYWRFFRKELQLLDVRRKAMALYATYSTRTEQSSIPAWITAIHVLFMTFIVVVSHYPAIFIAAFLFFIGFHQATRFYQDNLRMTRPLLVGLFLAGLVIHGELQGWWVVSLLQDMPPLSVMGIAMALTGFNDNTMISYLSTLVPNWGTIYQYAIFTGIIAGGGLTVIANAPNPAGYTILKKHFEKGIRPLYLFLGALVPTLILYAIFYFLGPLF